MSISQVRTYFKSRLSETDSDFREWTDGFNRENIPNNIYDKAYHIAYGSLASSALSDNFIEDNLSVSIQLFFKGYRDPAQAIDDALDKAHNFRLRCVSFPNATTGDDIKNVILTTMIPDFPESNDNMIIIDLEFVVRLCFDCI